MVTLARQAPRDLRELPELPASPESQVSLASLVLRVLPGQPERLVPPERLVSPDRPARMDLTDSKAHKGPLAFGDRRVLLARQASLASPALPESLVSLVSPALLARRGQLESPALVVKMVLMVLKDLLGPLASGVLLVQQARLALTVSMVWTVRRVAPARPGLPVRLLLPGRPAPRVRMVWTGLTDSLDILVRQARLAPLALPGQPDRRVRLVLPELRARPGQPEPPAQRGLLAHPDKTVSMGWKGLLGLLAHVVLPARQESLVSQESPGLPGSPARLVPLESLAPAGKTDLTDSMVRKERLVPLALLVPLPPLARPAPLDLTAWTVWMALQGIRVLRARRGLPASLGSLASPVSRVLPARPVLRE